MARRYVRELVDDFDGSAADEEITFGIGSKRYRIHLTTLRALEFRASLAPWVEHAELLAPPRKAPARRDQPARERAHAIRAWGLATGITGPDGRPVADHGRLPAWLKHAWDNRAEHAPAA